MTPVTPNNTSLQDELETAVRKGLKSKSAIERTAALKIAGDMTNPNLTDLKTKLGDTVRELEEARAALAAVTVERDMLKTANDDLGAKAERLTEVEQELAALKQNNDMWREQQVRELTELAVHERRNAELALNRARDLEREAQAKFATAGLQEAFDRLRDIAEKAGITAPEFWASSPTLSAKFWEVFGWSPAKAVIYTALRKAFQTPDEGFRRFALKVLLATGAQYTDAPPDTIDYLAEKVAFVREVAERFSVREEIEAEVAEIKSTAYAGWISRNNAQRAISEMKMARLGYGREEKLTEASASPTGYNGPHLEGCCCSVCGGPAPRNNSLEAL